MVEKVIVSTVVVRLRLLLNTKLNLVLLVKFNVEICCIYIIRFFVKVKNNKILMWVFQIVLLVEPRVCQLY